MREDIIIQLKEKEAELTKIEEQFFKYEGDRIEMEMLKNDIRELIREL